ncbi:MAG: hypothetical protein KAW12_12030 [Candidatus Aminicenantes bacterium]|nr:hypothetical protein [Candidatus Aminicenantes bacterium]
MTRENLDTGNIKCPYPECKDRQHPKGTKFCPHSGKPLQEEEPARNEEEPVWRQTSNKKTKQVFFFAILPAALVAVVILIIVLAGKSDVKAIDWNNLKPEITNNYKNRLESNLEKAVPGNEVKLSGELELYLGIDEKGEIRIQKYNSSKLTAAPGNSKEEIVGGLLEKIRNFTLPPHQIDGDPFAINNCKFNLTFGRTYKTIDYSQPGIEKKYRKQLAGYKKQLKRFLEEVTIAKMKAVQVSGHVELNLTINKKGKIILHPKSGNYKTVEVTPREKKSEVITTLENRIKELVRNRTIKLQQGKNKVFLEVKNLSFSAVVKQKTGKIEFDDLPDDLREKYRYRAGFLKELPYEENITLAGEIKLRLTIDEKGKITIQKNSDYRHLKVTPGSEKKKIIEKLEKEIANAVRTFTLEPYQNSKGVIFEVVNFEIPVTPVKIATVDFIDLSPEIIAAYKNQVKHLIEITAAGSIKLSGQIKLRLTIDEKGAVDIQKDSRFTLLKVTPANERERMIHMLKSKIRGLSITPQKNARGANLRVRNFPVTVKIIQKGGTVKLENIRK